MHMIQVAVENARYNKRCLLDLKTHGGSRIAKWTCLSAIEKNRELLQLIAVGIIGTQLCNQFSDRLKPVCCNPDQPVQVEYSLILYPPHEPKGYARNPWISGVRIDANGCSKKRSNRTGHGFKIDNPVCSPVTGMGDSWVFLLGYGPCFLSLDGNDDHDFNNQFFRTGWIHSLFYPDAPLTDPVEFLKRLHYRAIKYRRLAAQHILNRLSAGFQTHLNIDTSAWIKKECDFNQEWQLLLPWQKQVILPILDAARHMGAAFAKSAEPLDLPGLILFDHPHQICQEHSFFPKWITLMDALFPNTQFLMTTTEKARLLIPETILSKSFIIPPQKISKKTLSVLKAKAGTIVLIDVDSKLPNLALMKISRYWKERKHPVILTSWRTRVKNATAAYASVVFNSRASLNRLDELRRHYDNILIAGGSGIDLHNRLPVEIESLQPDYSLYPNLADRAIGFITRGCPFHCPFCVVPIKEGLPHQVSRLEDLLQGDRKKLILLDDNILSHPDSGQFLEEMIVRNLQVNFTQTLDLRLINPETAKLLKRIRCTNTRFSRSVFHFSLNDCRNLDTLQSRYNLLDFRAGTHNVEFVCMYGFNTTLAEDVERFLFLRSLPGAYVFVQEYMPYPGGPLPDLARFFDDHADLKIDELIRIQFPQNMKSLEKYYRWVSKQYVLTFGRVHPSLIDTIFRYNHREKRGYYLARMEDMARKPDAPPKKHTR